MHRPLAIAALVAIATLAAGCSNPCQDLGDRICDCNPSGVSTDTCKRQVSNMLDDANPSKDQESVCSDYLDRCDAPRGADFCTWLSSAEGKQACGLAYTP
jgi:predicted small secreted protein